MISALAHAYALSGNHSEGRKLLGNNELAMNWLQKAYLERSNGLVFLKVEPELDALRSDPRFISLLHKLNFPNSSN